VNGWSEGPRWWSGVAGRGPTKVGCKKKNFIRVEEEQLCKSVMLVSQDRVVGNQQKASVFWERISEHYIANRPDGVRPLRSLETKWGLIKHNVSKFCGIYNQIQRMHKSGSNAADTMSRTSPKGMLETPRAQGGPRSDTRDLWRRW
jgi:hypothetical protein